MSDSSRSSGEAQRIIETQAGFLEVLKLLESGDFKKAFLTKDKLIPKVLYKFVSLSEIQKCNKCGAKKHCHCSQCDSLDPCNFIVDNNDKIKSLEDNNLWLSKFDTLNDPFEFKSLYLDKSKIRYKKNSPELFGMIQNSIRISCFISALPSVHMPMWAHYANNHKGFCIEYEVKNSYLLYPVHYVTKREPIHNIPDRIVSAIIGTMNNQGEPPEEIRNLSLWLFLSAVVKSDFWQYEGEYRILNFATKPDKVGELMSVKESGLEVKHIYIGKSCSQAHRDKLLGVAKHNNWSVSDVYLDENSSDFILKYRKAN